MVNCRCTLQTTRKRLRFFLIIVSENQLSPYGGVKEICEEYNSFHERNGLLFVMGQSIVLRAINTEALSNSVDSAKQNLLLQQYEERIEKLSQQDKMSKFYMDA